MTTTNTDRRIGVTCRRDDNTVLLGGAKRKAYEAWLDNPVMRRHDDYADRRGASELASVHIDKADLKALLEMADDAGSALTCWPKSELIDGDASLPSDGEKLMALVKKIRGRYEC